MNSITRKWQYYSYKEIENSVKKIMENVKNSALKIAIGNVEKTTFYIPIYDKTQFILQSPDTPLIPYFLPTIFHFLNIAP